MSILRLPLALCLNFAVAAGVAGLAHSQISEQPIKVGVITDMNGPLASATGRGSVEAARMAAEEFGFSISGRPVEILSADHQNTPDIGAAIVRRWFDVGNVNAVADIANSAVGFAIVEIARPATRSSWSAPDPPTLPGGPVHRRASTGRGIPMARRPVR